jgi:hypothetical protein
VRRRIGVEGWHCAEAAILEGFGGHRTGRKQWRIDIGRGKQRRRPEDVSNVMIAGYDPMTDCI